MRVERGGRFATAAATSAAMIIFPAVRRKPARTRYPPTLPERKFKIILIIMNNHATV